MSKISQLFNRSKKTGAGCGKTIVENKSLKLVENAVGDATLYVYDDIGWYGVNAQDFAEALSQFDGQPLTVRISSNGGSVADGLAIYSMLRDYPGEVTTVNDSVAASIASVIFMAGNTRRASSYASFMTHKPMASFYGNTDDLVEFNEMLSHFNEVIAKAYEDGGVEPETAVGLIENGNKWFMASEALEIGFATEESDAPAAAANVNLDIFDNVPETVLNSVVNVTKGNDPVTESNEEISEALEMADENTITNEDHEIAVESAKVDARSEGFAEATKRYADIMALEETKGREAMAQKLAANASLSIDEIKALLAEVPVNNTNLSVENLTDDLGDLSGEGEARDDNDDEQPVNRVAVWKANCGYAEKS